MKSCFKIMSAACTWSFDSFMIFWFVSILSMGCVTILAQHLFQWPEEKDGEAPRVLQRYTAEKIFMLWRTCSNVSHSILAQMLKVKKRYILRVFQVRVNFVKDALKQEAMWERQHELAADKIFSMCYDLGGFFLKIAQIIGKPDLAPVAWVKRLVTLCDRAPPTPFDVVKLVLENELGQGIDDVFNRFDVEPLGSASISQGCYNSGPDKSV
ncbi:hypothetical protein JHK85_023222 [Glycine max]|nr:hypothetical protein JHK85_023222 [Glycine max]